MDLTKCIKVRMVLGGDVVEFIPAVATRMVENGLATYWEEKPKVETAAINKGSHTAARAAASLRTTTR